MTFLLKTNKYLFITEKTSHKKTKITYNHPFVSAQVLQLGSLLIVGRHEHRYGCTYRLTWWLSGKESTCDVGDVGLISWVGKMPWRRKWQPNPEFLPEKSHGQRSLGALNIP